MLKIPKKIKSIMNDVSKGYDLSESDYELITEFIDSMKIKEKYRYINNDCCIARILDNERCKVISKEGSISTIKLKWYTFNRNTDDCQIDLSCTKYDNHKIIYRSYNTIDLIKQIKENLHLN